MTLHSARTPEEILEAIDVEAVKAVPEDMRALGWDRIYYRRDGSTATIEPVTDRRVARIEYGRALRVRATVTPDPAGGTNVHINGRYDGVWNHALLAVGVLVLLASFFAREWYLILPAIAFLIAGAFLPPAYARRASETLTIQHPVASHLVGCVETAALRG